MPSPDEIKKEIEAGIRPDPRKQKSGGTEPTPEELSRYLPQEFIKGAVVSGLGGPIIDGATLRKLGINLEASHNLRVDLSKLTNKSRDELMNDLYADARKRWQEDRDRMKRGGF